MFSEIEGSSINGVLLVITPVQINLGKGNLYATGIMVAAVALFTGTSIQVSGFCIVILMEEGLRSIYGMLPVRLEVSASDSSYSVLSVLTSYAYMIVVVVAMLSSRRRILNLLSVTEPRLRGRKLLDILSQLSGLEESVHI